MKPTLFLAAEDNPRDPLDDFAPEALVAKVIQLGYEGGKMKNINLTVCIALLLSCLFWCGCDVQDVLKPTQFEILSAEATVISPVPDFIFTDVMAPRRNDLKEMFKAWNGAERDEQCCWMYTEEGVVPATKGQILDRKFKGVPFGENSQIDQQRAFYKKYIEAGGIAIVANAGVTDQEMIDARTVILTMTAKHPHLRDRLHMKHGFYMILLEQWTWGWDIPEKIVVSPEWGAINSCSTGSTGIWIDAEGYVRKPLGKYGYCYARLNQIMRFSTFIHEFAHALDREMELLDPDFKARVIRAQEQAPDGSWLKQANWYEYWANSVEYWFYRIGHDDYNETYEEFFQRQPLLAELLDEWFPRVSFLHLRSHSENLKKFERD